MKAYLIRAVLYTVIFFLLSESFLYSSSVKADPDYVATGFEFRGVPAVKIGDDIRLGGCGMPSVLIWFIKQHDCCVFDTLSAGKGPVRAALLIRH